MPSLTVAPPLPQEIIQHILCYIPYVSQATLFAATLISRAWNPSATQRLYYVPILSGKNFDAFVRAVCPSINPHIRHNGLAEFVRKLDMSGLVHSGSKSLTARLLGRLKHSLVELVAPQASFGISSLAAVSKCRSLRCLNLGFVSEAIPLSDLLRSINILNNLEILHLPRASTNSVADKAAFCDVWPANLRELHPNGGFHERNETRLTSITSSVTHLWIENCARPSFKLIHSFFKAKGTQFQFLRCGIRSSQTSPSCVLHIGLCCQNLLHLSINLEALCDAIDQAGHAIRFDSLTQLDIDCLQEHDDKELSHGLTQVSELLFSERAPRLRKLLIHRKLRWTESDVTSAHVADINELLKALAREDQDDHITEEEAGVIIYGKH